MANIIYKELSYKIIGILFKVYNDLGFGFQEKYYTNAIKAVFDKMKISYLEQVRTDLKIKDLYVGRYYLDFIVDNKIVLEIKTKQNFSSQDIRQVLGYLKKTKLELGILASFTREGIKFKRILKGKN